MQVSAADPSAFTLNFANGAPTATLVPSGDTASLSGSANYDFRNSGGTGPHVCNTPHRLRLRPMPS